MTKKTFYITTPIYYPSGNLHIGHVYTTTIAWVLRNYKKKMGYETLFLTGADEHGLKIEQKAKNNNISPQKYVDTMLIRFKNLWEKYEIDYDIFSRTTNIEHIKSVKNIFSYLYDDKKIYLGKYKGLYSVEDEEFIAEKNAIKKNMKFYHPISNHVLKEIEEESYFLKLDNQIQWWKQYVKQNNGFIKPNKVVKELESNFINNGLKDLSITRTSFDWGIQPNENNKHVIYVWLDALSNYITMLGYKSNNDSLYKKFWKNGDEIIHIIGKEITRFHCIYWPIILHLLDVKQPTLIQSHGWIVTPSGKMSKSKGNVIDPISLLNTFNPEIIKYFLVRKLKIDHDNVLTSNMIKETYNAELVNTYGNLVSRTISMLDQNFPDNILHNIPSSKETNDFNEMIKKCFENYKANMDDIKIHVALEWIMKLGKYSNNYIDITMPWKLKNQPKKLMPILFNLFNSIYAMSAMLDIVIPNKIKKVSQSFNIKNFEFSQICNFNKLDNKKINAKEFKIIFPRI